MSANLCAFHVNTVSVDLFCDWIWVLKFNWFRSDEHKYEVSSGRSAMATEFAISDVNKNATEAIDKK